MTRDELLKGLEGMVQAQDEFREWEAGILRAAIALLRVPSVAEIEAARHFVRDCQTFTGLQLNHAVLTTLRRALDALAREPGLVDAYDKLEADRNNLLCEREKACARIATLEAQLKSATALEEAHERSSRANLGVISHLQSQVVFRDEALVRSGERISTLEAKLARVAALVVAVGERCICQGLRDDAICTGMRPTNPESWCPVCQCRCLLTDSEIDAALTPAAAPTKEPA